MTKSYRKFLTKVLIGMMAFISISYLFFSTTGKMTTFTEHPYSYYSMLADSFLQGRISLIAETPPELIGKNVYAEPQLKKFVIWDTIFFENKFYLYFAPFPAVLIAIVKGFGFHDFGDGHLTFVFQMVRMILFGILFLKILSAQTRKNSVLIFLAALLALAFSAPFPYLLGRSVVYETAISGAQCFLMGGILCLYTFLQSFRVHSLWLIASGILFALAFSCRTSLLPSIFVFLAFTIWFLQKYFSDRKSFLFRFASLLAPSVVVLALLGFYNYARFHNPFEFGLKYMNTIGNPPIEFSLGFLLPNLWNYFFRFPELTATFPFFKMPMPWGPFLPHFISYPGNYVITEPLMGMLPGSPVVLIFIFAIPLILRVRKDYEMKLENLWLIQGAVLLSVCTFGFNLAINVFSMRYLADFMPSMLLAGFAALSVEGFLGGRFRKLVVITFFVLALYSTCICLLLWTDSNVQILPRYNPELLRFFVKLFGGK